MDKLHIGKIVGYIVFSIFYGCIGYIVHLEGGATLALCFLAGSFLGSYVLIIAGNLVVGVKKWWEI